MEARSYAADCAVFLALRCLFRIYSALHSIPSLHYPDYPNYYKPPRVGTLNSLSLTPCLAQYTVDACAGHYVNLTQARVIREDVTSSKEMSPVGNPVAHFLD